MNEDVIAWNDRIYKSTVEKRTVPSAQLEEGLYPAHLESSEMDMLCLPVEESEKFTSGR